MAVRNKGFLTGAVVGAGVAGAALAGIGLQWPQARADQELTPPPGQGAVRQVPPAGAPLSFADIIQRVSPAVVSIHATGRARPEQLRQQFGGLPFSFGQGEGGIDPEDLPQAQSAGSGFFIRSDGYLVTNNHVIEGADEITVRLSDEREFPARVVGRDESTDLAVLKVEGNGFPFVSFATDRPARVGDWVIAVGNPFDLGGTVTAGIVSAYGRTLPRESGSYPVEYLQVDAPINRGNSGGPTFDTAGRVIGVNTAIFSDLPTGGSVGIGFAIPATLADQVTRQLITTGRFTRGYLGATVQNLTPEIAEGLGLGRERRGAVVSDVTAGGPGARAGLQLNDVILTFNGEPVRDNSDLTRRVSGVAAGQTFRLGVLRAGREQTITVTSGTRPSESELTRSQQGGPQGESQGGASGGKPNGEAEAAPAGTAVVGLTVAPVDAALRQQYQLDAQAQGLVVTAMERGLRGDAGRLRAGDVILQVNGRPATSAAVFQQAVEEARRANRSTVALFVRTRGSNGQFVNVAIAAFVNPTRPATPPAR